MNRKNNNFNNNSNQVIWDIIICIILGCIYSATSGFISIIVGYIASLYICVKLFILDISDSYILLFGTQFFREVIRIRIADSNFSFLLIAFPIFLLILLYKNNLKISWSIIIGFLIGIWDIIVSYYNNNLVIGDQILWTMSFMIFLAFATKENNIQINKILNAFGIAIWGICIINIIAEFRLFGQSLVPSMYGTWNKEQEYYSFGKGYVNIAGGNEIAQYIPLFIAFSLYNFKEYKLNKKIIYIISYAFFIYCGIMCVARAFYIEMIIIILTYVIYNICKKPIKLFLVFFTTIIVIYISYSKFLVQLSPTLEAVLERFNNGNEYRTYLLKSTIDLWKSNTFNILLGIGTEYTKNFETVHNIFMDSLISLGLLGSILYWGLIIKEFLKNKTSITKLEKYIPLIMLIAYKSISGCVKDVPFYFIIGIIFINIKSNKEGYEKLYEQKNSN